MKNLFLKIFSLTIIFWLGIFFAYMAGQPKLQPTSIMDLVQKSPSKNKKKIYVSNGVSTAGLDEGSDYGMDSLKKVYGVAQVNKSLPTLKIQLQILKGQQDIKSGQKECSRKMDSLMLRKPDTVKITIHDTLPPVHDTIRYLPITPNFINLKFGKNKTMPYEMVMVNEKGDTIKVAKRD